MLTSFDPVQFSNAENEFLLKHLGEATIVALKSIKAERGSTHTSGGRADKNPLIYPEGVVPASVRPVLDGINELIELERHEGLKWVGVETIKATIVKWFEQNQKWAMDYKRSNKRAPRWPSLYSWDGKGKAHLGGPGSDSGTIKTYFDTKGNRVPFAIDLLLVDDYKWLPPGATDQPSETGLRLEEDAHRYECRVPFADGTICGHTESFKEGSRASKNAARARMSKHLRKATKEAEAHRELHTNEFGS